MKVSLKRYLKYLLILCLLIFCWSILILIYDKSKRIRFKIFFHVMLEIRIKISKFYLEIFYCFSLENILTINKKGNNYFV
jgi:hypothetical protein